MKAQKNQLDNELNIIRRDFDRHKVDPYKRDEIFVAWETQIKVDHNALGEIDNKCVELEKVKIEIAAKIAVAEELIKRFTNLDATREQLIEHNAKADKMKLLSERRERGESALRKVKPFADKAVDANKQYETARMEFEEAKIDAETAFKELEEAKKAFAELSPPADARNAFEQIKRQYELTAEKLTRLNVLQSDYTLIASKHTALEVLQAEFETLNAEFILADGKYKAVNEAFLRSQAGILAGSLIDGKPCPVCGSTEHPLPAKLSDDDVTEAKLKKAKDTTDKAQIKRDGKVSECAVLKAEAETLSTRLFADLSVFAHDVQLETVDVFLADLITRTKSELNTLTGQKEADEKAISETAEVLTEAAKKRDELYPKCTELKTEIETLTKRFIDDLLEVVPNAARDTAGKILNEVIKQTKSSVDELSFRKEVGERSLVELIANWETVAKRNAEAETIYKSAITLLTERENRERTQKKLQDEAKDVFHHSLNNNGFTDETTYNYALVTEDEFAQITRQLADYEKMGEQFNHDIKRLENETANKVRPDLEKLTAESDEIKAAADELRDKRDGIKSRLEQTERALKELRRSAEQIAKFEKQYVAVKQLSDTANGRLDFETYAQMAYFERVLRAANQRLKVMSQNRYSLMRKTDSGDGRKRAERA